MRPHRPALVTLHGVDTPYASSSPASPGGRFRFRGLEGGVYSISVYVPGLGQFQQTQAVGPATADKKGAVRVTVICHADRATPVEEHTVPIGRLSIPAAASRQYAEAQKRLSRGDAPAAEDHLRRAVEIAPRFAAAWNNLGTLAYQQQRYEEAERCFREALRADPESYEPKVNLGGVLLSLHRPEDALPWNAECVLARPKDALANSQLGLTYFLKGDAALAERYLTEARRLDPAHFSHPQWILAQIFQKQGRKEAAARELQSLLRHHPDHANADLWKKTLEQLR